MAHQHAVRTTEKLFSRFSIPTTQCLANSRARFTEVQSVFRDAFHRFTIAPWPDFNHEACQVLAGSRSQRMSDATWISICQLWDSSMSNADCEADLSSVYYTNLIWPANRLIDRNRGEWRQGGGVKRVLQLSHGNRRPDFHYSTDTATLAVGELKTQALNVQQQISVSDLIRSLDRPFKDVRRDGDLNPFFQTLSYMLETKNGIGVISNYNQARYLRLDLHRSRVYVSPTVRVNQTLTNSKPHPLQAMIYASTFVVPQQDFNKSLAQSLYKKFKDKHGDDRRDEESNSRATDAKSGSSSKSRASSSKSKSRSRNKASSSKSKALDSHEEDTGGPTHVGRVFFSMEFVGHLGSGVCGDVYEYDYHGLRVAVKVGLPYTERDECDSFKHVENEIEAYDRLKHLQGEYVPRVIAAGYDSYVTAAGLMLITEKVGEPLLVQKGKGRLFVGSREISREELDEIEEEAVRGLRAIAEGGVLRSDCHVANMRVGMEDGRVRVWWIDFGYYELCEPNAESVESSEWTARNTMRDLRRELEWESWA